MFLVTLLPFLVVAFSAVHGRVDPPPSVTEKNHHDLDLSLLTSGALRGGGAISMKASRRAEGEGNTEGHSDSGDISLPISIGLGHCGNDLKSENCKILESIKALSTVTTFTSCANIPLEDFVGLFTEIISDYEKFSGACRGVDGGNNATGCAAAIAGIAYQNDSPLAPFIKGLLQNPKKYCNCNKKFYDSAPTCKVDVPNIGDVDLGQVKEFSCLFADMCEDIDQACGLLEEGTLACLNSAGLSNAANNTSLDCSLKCSVAETPSSCLNKEFGSELKQKMAKYKKQCGGESPDHHDDFGKCLTIYDNVDEESLPSCKFSPQLGSAVLQFGQVRLHCCWLRNVGREDFLDFLFLFHVHFVHYCTLTHSFAVHRLGCR